MAHIDDVTDYIIVRLSDSGTPLNQLKLQKLLYYVQSWHLALFEKPIFNGKFQAWVHGPVNRAIYDRFKPAKALYSSIYRTDIQSGFNSVERLSSEEIKFIDAVLNEYAGLSGDQLEEMTHREDPWRITRADLAPDERCEREIAETLMHDYYSAR